MSESVVVEATDSDLHAFVDGQLDPVRIPAVLQRLRLNPEDAQRVAHWQAQRLQLRQLARTIDVGETPAAITAIVRGGWRAAVHGGWLQATAAIVLMAVGVAAGIGWSLWRGEVDQPASPASVAASPGFVRDAVVAHAVFAVEKRHPVEVAAADEAHLVQWLTRRLGTPVKAPVLLELGYRLLGGRLLPGEPVPRAQFMYESADGRRATLYVAVFPPGQEAGATSFRSLRDGSRESFYWVDGRLGYALSAELPPAELQVLARAVYAQLGR